MVPAKSGKPGIGAEEVFSKWLKRENFPVSVFWGGAEFASGGARRSGVGRKSTKSVHFGGSTVVEL
jgi:hypothetical protein